VCNMTGKVVGGKLILRIESLFPEVLGPTRELRPISLSEMRVAFGLCKGIHEDKHVAAFLHGHLVLLGLFPAAVNLPIGKGILSQIVRREGKPPTREGGILKYGEKLRLKQLWLEEKEEWSGRVEHIDGGYAAVGEILLCEEHRIAVHIGNKLVGGERLSIGQDGNGCVMLSPRRCQIGGQLCIEGVGTFIKRRVLCFRIIEHLLNGHVVTLPIGPQILL